MALDLNSMDKHERIQYWTNRFHQAQCRGFLSTAHANGITNIVSGVIVCVGLVLIAAMVLIPASAVRQCRATALRETDPMSQKTALRRRNEKTKDSALRAEEEEKIKQLINTLEDADNVKTDDVKTDDVKTDDVKTDDLKTDVKTTEKPKKEKDDRDVLTKEDSGQTVPPTERTKAVATETKTTNDEEVADYAEDDDDDATTTTIKMKVQDKTVGNKKPFLYLKRHLTGTPTTVKSTGFQTYKTTVTNNSTLPATRSVETATNKRVVRSAFPKTTSFKDIADEYLILERYGPARKNGNGHKIAPRIRGPVTGRMMTPPFAQSRPLLN